MSAKKTAIDKIAIQAPEEIAIHRQEVRKRIERERGAE